MSTFQGKELFELARRACEVKKLAQKLFNGENLSKAIEARNRAQELQKWQYYCAIWGEIGKLVWLAHHQEGRCHSTQCTCTRKKPNGQTLKS